MNDSKKNDPRYIKIWRNNGAIKPDIEFSPGFVDALCEHHGGSANGWDTVSLSDYPCAPKPKHYFMVRTNRKLELGQKLSELPRGAWPLEWFDFDSF